MFFKATAFYKLVDSEPILKFDLLAFKCSLAFTTDIISGGQIFSEGGYTVFKEHKTIVGTESN
jgi:hypothetical protein